MTNPLILSITLVNCLLFYCFLTHVIKLSIEILYRAKILLYLAVKFCCYDHVQAQFRWHCVEQFKGFPLVHSVLQKLWGLFLFFVFCKIVLKCMYFALDSKNGC